MINLPPLGRWQPSHIDHTGSRYDHLLDVFELIRRHNLYVTWFRLGPGYRADNSRASKIYRAKNICQKSRQYLFPRKQTYLATIRRRSGDTVTIIGLQDYNDNTLPKTARPLAQNKEELHQNTSTNHISHISVCHLLDDCAILL
jgi:hypothetical protein